MQGITISGFADEICNDFAQQLTVVKRLGMAYISLRSAWGKNIADYTPDEIRETVLPCLQTAGVKVSSLGSPIGKIDIQDEPAFQRQLAQLESLCGICKLLDCRYIRVFSFFIPPEQDPEAFRDRVLEKLAQFESAARQHGIILLHENEKGIYGDTAGRCLTLLRSIGSPYLRAAFDYANFVQCGQDTVQAAAAQLCNVHPRQGRPGIRWGKCSLRHRRRTDRAAAAPGHPSGRLPGLSDAGASSGFV